MSKGSRIDKCTWENTGESLQSLVQSRFSQTWAHSDISKTLPIAKNTALTK